MKNIKSPLLLLAAAVLFASCEKVVDIDLETSQSKPVIEGLVTDKPGMSYVKISMSSAYFDVQHSATVSNAVVEITDGNGTPVIFAETAPGYYQPTQAFTGQVGENYSLKAVLKNGQTLVAHSFMRKVAEIENITARFFDDNNEEGKEKGYYAYISFYELPGVGDSYKVDLYANGKSKVERPNDLFYFNDKYIDGGHAVDWEFTQKLQKGDSITMVMYSLSEDGYKFYDAMYMIAEAGGLFGKNPSNIPTNIQGDAFGYFGASAISTKSIIVE
jgi:hypothetical protein